jgi:hypothetical protein
MLPPGARPRPVLIHIPTRKELAAAAAAAAAATRAAARGGGRGRGRGAKRAAPAGRGAEDEAGEAQGGYAQLKRKRGERGRAAAGARRQAALSDADEDEDDWEAAGGGAGAVAEAGGGGGGACEVPGGQDTAWDDDPAFGDVQPQLLPAPPRPRQQQLPAPRQHPQQQDLRPRQQQAPAPEVNAPGGVLLTTAAWEGPSSCGVAPGHLECTWDDDDLAAALLADAGPKAAAGVAASVGRRLVDMATRGERTQQQRQQQEEQQEEQEQGREEEQEQQEGQEEEDREGGSAFRIDARGALLATPAAAALLLPGGGGVRALQALLAPMAEGELQEAAAACGRPLAGLALLHYVHRGAGEAGARRAGEPRFGLLHSAGCTSRQHVWGLPSFFQRWALTCCARELNISPP